VSERDPTYEYAFDPTSKNDTAAAVYRFARDGGTRVLDLGSGPAIVSSHLKREDGKDVTCVDNSTERLAAARERGITRLIEADLESAAWSDAIDGESFDVIILADVLEHLREPEVLLRLIRERGLLAEGGRLVVSIPNIAHEAVAAELLSGRFRYREAGLLDATHVHFFTYDSFVNLLGREGYVVTRLHRTTIPLERTEMASLAAELSAEVRELLTTMPEGRTYQFVACAEPAGEALELSRLQGRLRQAEQDRDRVAGDAELQKVRHADEGDRLRDQITTLRAQNRALKGKLERTYASKSWRYGRGLARVGRAVAHPWRTVTSRLRRGKAEARERDEATTGARSHLELRANP
jgi:SAM-dependent methyltransferase